MYTVIETDVFVCGSAGLDRCRACRVHRLAGGQHGCERRHFEFRGCRKVRWTRSGMGKRGGARVIYFNRLEQGEIWLLMVYVKAKFDNLPAPF